MSGQLDNLSDEQGKALENFKSQLSDDYLSNDGTYLRFLRARKFVVQDALKQYRETCDWRREKDVDTILERPQPLEEEIQEILASSYHGFDKEGRPLYLQCSGSMDVERLVAFPIDDLIYRHVYHNEKQISRAEQNSTRLGRNIETVAEIHDMSGMGLVHRKSLSLLRNVINIDQTYYPERLGRAFFINVPRLFYILWQIAKVWLDPVTATKFVLLPPDQINKLKEYIDADQLPVEFGGTCTCPNGCFDYLGKKKANGPVVNSNDLGTPV
ncbi:uncharacterized protein [Dysidea avara]|uniref:uncharacterized protein n=1 Tax=Dysidea avara TaxID=196820 RepID=UPI00331AD45E